jgi:hypothetical protein
MLILMNTDIRSIGNLCKKPLDAPVDSEVQCAMHNQLEFHWGYREGSAVPLLACTLISDNNRGNANICDGSDAFNADQIGRILGVKVPPFAKCHIEVKDAHATIRYAGEWIQLGLRVLKEHILAFQLEGSLIEAPVATSWWLPYDLEAVMRFGNSLNSSIPSNLAEAEFPPTPWADRVVIRVKSTAAPNIPLAPLSAGCSPPAPGLPKTWADVDTRLGHTPPISEASSGLAEYTSPNEQKTSKIQDDPGALEELRRSRGLEGGNEAVHKILSWANRKNYEVHVGISLEIPDTEGSESHEIRYWESSRDWPMLQTAAELYTSLAQRLTLRSSKGVIPIGMPNPDEEFEVLVSQSRKGGYIQFIPRHLIMRPVEAHPPLWALTK